LWRRETKVTQRWLRKRHAPEHANAGGLCSFDFAEARLNHGLSNKTNRGEQPKHMFHGVL
jgi:hypothetical protein